MLAPQHPFAERDFKVPGCPLVMKLLCGMGCGVWQGKVGDKRWCPCSPGATSRLQFWGDFGGFWWLCLQGALCGWRRGEAEMGAGG